VQEGFDLFVENFWEERTSAKWIETSFDPLLRHFEC